MRRENHFDGISDPHEPVLAESQLKLIEHLRSEGAHVKDCFTKFSFQALVISTGVIGFVLTHLKEQPYVALASILACAFILVVIRIGTYKFGTANRNFGYDLHLHTMLRFEQMDSPCCTELIRASKHIGWEEAMRAWRVVQPTVFKHVCRIGFLHGSTLREEFQNPPNWLTPGTLASEGNDAADYYAGSYLRRMVEMLSLAAALALLPIPLMLLELFQQNAPTIAILACMAATLAAVGCVMLAFLKTRRRVELLEAGILSIPACATMWHAVVLCHYRAKRIASKSSDDDIIDLDESLYLKALSKEAVSLREAISNENDFSISGWLKSRDGEVKAASDRFDWQMLSPHS